MEGVNGKSGFWFLRPQRKNQVVCPSDPTIMGSQYRLTAVFHRW